MSETQPNEVVEEFADAFRRVVPHELVEKYLTFNATPATLRTLTIKRIPGGGGLTAQEKLFLDGHRAARSAMVDAFVAEWNSGRLGDAEGKRTRTGTTYEPIACPGRLWTLEIVSPEDGIIRDPDNRNGRIYGLRYRRRAPDKQPQIKAKQAPDERPRPEVPPTVQKFIEDAERLWPGGAWKTEGHNRGRPGRLIKGIADRFGKDHVHSDDAARRALGLKPMKPSP